MDPVWYRMLVRELERPLGEIADNLSYVLGKLPGLDLIEGRRRGIAAVCETFRSAVAEEEARVRDALGVEPEMFKADDLHLVLQPMVARLQEEARAYDVLVREARADPDATLLEILLNESGANILHALQDLRDRVAGLAADAPERIEERHVLACAVCGKPAAVFDLDVDRSTGRRLLRFRGLTCSYELPMNGDLLASVRSADAPALHARIPDGLDAYCPQCRLVYCREHCQLQEVYDEGFYDCTYGTCPSGHRRMVDD